jgi:hypothetical protein
MQVLNCDEEGESASNRRFRPWVNPGQTCAKGYLEAGHGKPCPGRVGDKEDGSDARYRKRDGGYHPGVPAALVFLDGIFPIAAVDDNRILLYSPKISGSGWVTISKVPTGVRVPSG